MKYAKLLLYSGALFLFFSICVYAQTNSPPTANAGVNRNVVAGEETKLFGSGTDADGNTLTFKWLLIDAPGGSLASLSYDNAPNPSFTPDLEGLYTFNLRTNDGAAFSTPSTVVITANTKNPANSRPSSYPGPGRNVDAGQDVAIAGFGSDNDGDYLIYMWYILSSPAGSKAALSDSSTNTLVFKPDMQGRYSLALMVNDGKEDSSQNEVIVTASTPGSNRAPSADAGYNKTVKTGAASTLAGNGFDPDKDPLTFTWVVVSKPLGSSAALSNNNMPNPSFTPDKDGNYTFSLSVDDGKLNSLPNTVAYAAKTSSGNNKPTANAGTDINVNFGEKAVLQGSGSDADGNKIEFRWSIISFPVGGSAYLSNPNAQNPIFTPAIKGPYTVQLITNDGKEDSDADMATINAIEIAKECIEGRCDLNTKQWCDNGVWSSANYCWRCGNQDSSCPLCENNACDTDNQKWCNSTAWSVLNYCGKCGNADSTCANKTCQSGFCDTKNRKWCDNNAWKENNYCINCGSKDSTCSFSCIDKACDTKNQRWCNQGKWTNADYCINCGSKDFSCGAACENNACDTIANRWCDIISWTPLNYCAHCYDSQCLATCGTNACDINAKKWCDNGAWSSANYCDKCGNKDYSCASVCQENICDTTSNKRCSNGAWNSSKYCDYCTVKDSDCTIGCAEGECNTLNKKVCINGEWLNKTKDEYCSFCAAQDTTCGVKCLAAKDDCCSGASDKICDPDCAILSDSDCANCTSSRENCCLPKSDNICDLDCSPDMDLDCIKAADCRDSGTCGIGANCTNSLQCASGFCFDAKCTDQCKDSIKDGNETDVDCGGECGKCANYKNCNADSDCSSDFCSSGTCMEEAACDDAILNGNETDVDCGGECPAKCEAGKNCGVDSDCESDLECSFQICSEIEVEAPMPEEIPIPDEKKDSDKDGIPDKWELKYGMDVLNPSDAEKDLDADGLTNLQEYTLGTNPNSPDTDGDKVSDKEETESSTNPLDPISKPGGIGGLLFLTIILIILFGAGGYGVFYYIHYVRGESALPEPGFAATYPVMPYAAPRTVPRKDLTKIKIDEAIQKRREEKKKLRESIFGAFDRSVEPKPVEPEKALAKPTEEAKKPKILPKKEQRPYKRTQKQDAFSKLEAIYRKEEEKRKEN